MSDPSDDDDNNNNNNNNNNVDVDDSDVDDIIPNFDVGLQGSSSGIDPLVRKAYIDESGLMLKSPQRILGTLCFFASFSAC